MEKKTILATLGGAVVLFLLGGLAFAVILGNMYGDWSKALGDCVYQGDQMPIYVPIVANLFMALLLSLVYNKLGIGTFKTGAMHGAWIGALISLWFDTWMLGTFPSFTINMVVMDLIANTILSALGGGVIGLILGKVK